MGNNIRGITIEINGKATGLQKALKDTNKDIRSTQSELKEVNKLLKLDPKNTELLAQKQTLLKNAISETKERLDVLKTAEAQVQEQFRKGEATEEQYRAIQREVIATENALKSLENQAKENNITLEKVGEAFGKIGDVSTNLGKKMLPATTAIMGIGTAAGTMASNFEDAMAKVNTIADTTQVPLDELEKAILDLSDETGIAATDIADNVYNAISAGQQTGDAVNFVSNATKLAKAGFAESADALDILTTIMNAYGMEAGQVTNVSDMLIQTQNLGKTTVAELSSAMGKVIPTAKAQGVELDSLCGAYAVMTSNGIATAETTTYLNSMLNELGKQGSTAAKAFAEGTEHIKEGGLTMAEAMEQGWSLTDVLSILDEQAYVSGTSIANMFSSAEAGKAANVLWDNAEKLDNAIGEMANSAGATETAFNKLDTTSNKVKIAINQVKNTAIDLGGTLIDSLQPIIQKVCDKVKEFSEWFKNLNESQKQTIIKIAAIVAAIGPALIAFGKMSTGISGIIKTVSGLSGKIGGLKGVLTALTGPVGIVIGILAALAAGFIHLYKTNDEFREKVDNCIGRVKQAFTQMWTAVQPLLESLKQAFTNLMTALQPVFEFLLTYIMSIVNGVINAAAPIISAIQNIVDFVTNIINAVVALLHGDFDGFFSYIKAALQNAINFAKNIIQAWVNFIVGFFEGFGVNVKQIFSDIWHGICSIFQGVGQWFADRFNEAYTNITNIFAAIGQWFGARWNDIKNALATVAAWFLTMFTNAYTNVTNVFAAIGQWFGARWTDIKNALATVATWFLTMFTNAYTNVTNAFAAIGSWFGARWTEVKTALANVPAWFKTQFDNAWTNIKNAFANVTSFFSDLWKRIKACFVNVGVAIGSAVGNAFKSAINSCLSTIEGVVNKFIGMINGVIGIINEIPGVSLGQISTLSLPRLAKGGVLKEGTAMVAEAGPELLSMVNGKAVVTPLTGSAANRAADNLKGGNSFQQNINITSPKALSPYEVGRQTRLQTRALALAMQRGKLCPT